MRVTLHLNNSRLASHLYTKTVIVHINSKLAREMGVSLTSDVAGRQLPLVMAPVQELGDGSLHVLGPHLPRLITVAKKGRKMWEC